MTDRRAVALLGPTASGKTDAAIQVAERFPVDLISVDSAMVYRGMDIGTAKPSAEVLARHPHALVDILEPSARYSAAQFVTDADAAVQRAFDAGRTPVLVGGTMLYFRALKLGLNALPPANAALRRKLSEDAERVGWPALHRRLAARDPKTAANIDPNNGQRIQRALEVLMATGRSLAESWAAPSRAADERLGCDLVEVAVIPPDRTALHRRVAARTDAMLTQGFLAEVARLRDDPALHADLPSMRAVGYRQVWRYLDGELAYDVLVERIRAATRQLAKRQFTWLRRWDGLLATQDTAEAVKRISEILGQP